ncbi:hypothetical protein D3C76_1864580 [compost metagenome]
MATERKNPDVEDEDEPSEKELELERKKNVTWKHEDRSQLSERDEERPLKP